MTVLDIGPDDFDPSNAFDIGEWLEIDTIDHRTYSGILQDFTEDYIILNGCGFPMEDILEMRHGS